MFSLDRFVAAQDAVYEKVVGELGRGRKTSHWMWFVFPQIQGLGSSSMARHYAIGSLGEARAYLAHPILGQRLRECANLVAGSKAGSAEEIFGSIDAMKLRSSMTLFNLASGGEEPFKLVLDRYFEGRLDPKTLEILSGSQR